MRQVDDIASCSVPASSVTRPVVEDVAALTLDILRSRFPGSVDHALATFGSPAKAMDWLTAGCGALANQIPLDLLMRGDVEAVETELGRIEYGIYV